MVTIADRLGALDTGPRRGRQAGLPLSLSGNLLLAEGRPWVESILADMPASAAAFVDGGQLRRQWQRVLAGRAGNDHGFSRVLFLLRWMQLGGH